MYCFIYLLCILGLIVFCCVLPASNKARDDDDDDDDDVSYQFVIPNDCNTAFVTIIIVGVQLTLVVYFDRGNEGRCHC